MKKRMETLCIQICNEKPELILARNKMNVVILENS